MWRSAYECSSTCVLAVCSVLLSLPPLLWLQSCHPQGAGPSVEEGVAERLKQADLEKLKKLTQRFTSPMQRGWGKQHHQNGCYYVGEEEFFHKFIILADRYRGLSGRD